MMPTYREQLIHQLQCQGAFTEQGATELTDAAITEATGEAYNGELAMLRTLVRTVRAAARYATDVDEIRRLLAEHAGTDAMERVKAGERR